jgi:hypothetical protein
LLDKGMALIPLGSGRFADDPDTRRGINAMRHHNSVFHGLLKHLPWDEFAGLVAAHGAGSRVRRLTTKSQLMALLYGQLAAATSLREIVTGLRSHAARLYHLGAKVPRRSTLADANAQRPSAVFSELLAMMIARAIAVCAGRWPKPLIWLTPPGSGSMPAALAGRVFPKGCAAPSCT